jgi:chromosome partitioning protein
MAARVVTIAQQKGGAGKTTLVAQLACAFARKGRKVGLLDTDPQQSLTAWFAVRREAGFIDDLPIEAHQADGWRISTEVDRLKRQRDIVIVDSPPHAEQASKASIRSAELVLVPIQLSPMDLWATRATLDLAEAEKRPILLVPNRVPSRGRLGETVKEILGQEKLPLAVSELGNRQAFAASLMEGRGVVETEPSSVAAEEIAALANEVWRKLASIK